MHFIIYDIEATCWMGRPPKGHNEIIEIGAIKVNVFGELLGRFSRYVRPTLNPKLSGFCTKLTSITQFDVDSAQTFKYVISDFKDWVFDGSDDYLLCSWGSFDKQFFINDCKLHCLDYEWVTGKDLNVKQQYHEIKKLAKHGGLKKTIKKEGFEFTGTHHRAIADAENLTKIFIKYIDEWRY